MLWAYAYAPKMHGERNTAAKGRNRALPELRSVLYSCHLTSPSLYICNLPISLPSRLYGLDWRKHHTAKGQVMKVRTRQHALLQVGNGVKSHMQHILPGSSNPTRFILAEAFQVLMEKGLRGRKSKVKGPVLTPC